jgi:hypothetical protein
MTVFWDVAPCGVIEIDWLNTLMMEAVSQLKCQSIFTRLHSTTSQKTVIFILDAVRTWNLTKNLHPFFAPPTFHIPKPYVQWASNTSTFLFRVCALPLNPRAILWTFFTALTSHNPIYYVVLPGRKLNWLPANVDVISLRDITPADSAIACLPIHGNPLCKVTYRPGPANLPALTDYISEAPENGSRASSPTVVILF